MRRGADEQTLPAQQRGAFEYQVDGTHYTDMVLQPSLYVYLNGIGFSEGTAIAYLSRWRKKGGLKDLKKAIHTIEQLIAMEEKYAAPAPGPDMDDRFCNV